MARTWRVGATLKCLKQAKAVVPQRVHQAIAQSESRLARVQMQQPKLNPVGALMMICQI